MALSEWPGRFRVSQVDDVDLVTVLFVDDLVVIAETENAIGIGPHDGKREIEFWLPKSQLGDGYPRRDAVVESIEMSKWLAEKNDLNYEEE